MKTIESTVFDRLSMTEPMGQRGVTKTVTLTLTATTANGVTHLAVIADSEREPST